MSGKQSMSLSTLDKIAEALGLQIIVGVSGVLTERIIDYQQSNGQRPILQKSRKRGRPKKEKLKMQKLKRLTRFEWGWLAANAAKEAHEENFSSRRGVYVVQGAGIVYYDNNPFNLPREKDLREELIAQFREFLRRSNLKEKSSAYWPVSGESKDYTFAMVIQAEEFMLNAIRVAFQSIVSSFMKGMHERNLATGHVR
jgi:hypothetical protein